MGVGDWFSSFCSNLRLTPEQRLSFALRSGRIARVLNEDFRNTSSEITNRFYVGSMGRGTAIPSVSDVDLLYVMPYETYARFNAYQGNKQSSFLAAVRNSIRRTYPNSAISGDGQVVVIKFSDGVTYEVLPAFLNTNNSYTFADSNGGGAWRSCKPKHEMDEFATVNKRCNENLAELCRMTRAWRDYHSVNISGMLIDTLAYQFIKTWDYREKSYYYYDWMVRDFFGFLAGQSSTKKNWLAPGSGSYVYRTGPFEFRAKQAYIKAIEAAEALGQKYEWKAKTRFKEIFGPTFTG